MERMILDLNLLMKDLLRRVDRHRVGDNIELILDLGQDLGKVQGIPGKIDEVILGLVSSARKAIPKGGRVVISTHNAVVVGEVPTNPFDPAPRRFVVVSVSISGAGMVPEVQKMIFAPFSATQERSKEIGAGLPLPTVYGPAGTVGGDLSGSSEQSQKTLFQVYFPQEERSKVQKTLGG